MGGEEDGVSVPPTSRAGLRNTINVCFSRLSSLQPSSCNFQVGKKKIHEVCDVFHFLNGAVRAQRCVHYGDDLREFLRKWRKNSREVKKNPKKPSSNTKPRDWENKTLVKKPARL